MQVGLGITVTSANEDELGEVSRVVVDPDKNTLTHVVIGGGAGDGRAVPVWAIAQAEDGRVSLEADSATVDQFPRYRSGEKRGSPSLGALPHEPGEFPSLFPEDGSFPRGAVSLGANTEVSCGTGKTLGRLAAVFADDYTAEITDLVLRLHGSERLVDVPMSWARALTPGTIGLDCKEDDVDSLPDTVWQPTP